MFSKLVKNDKAIPLYFVAFFLVVAIIDGILVYLATSTHSGLVTENAYKKGLNYNQQIAAFNKQVLTGWSGEIGFNNETLSFKLIDKGGEPIVGAKVVAHVLRSTMSGLDFKVTLQDQGKGRYEVKGANFPLKGQWDIIVVAEWNQQKYQQSKRIIVN